MAFDSDVEFDPVSRQYSKSPLGELALTLVEEKSLCSCCSTYDS